ncbi:putative glycoside hydrolase family 55 protein [Botrytis fragariae]|uniref:Putative glycoside hydrolase family 55 protein n=1 Tax=Botrytis fragariae TaxID=1964551 RepID=A0A8H6EIE6_9HELO|nr:putative glycoside hydrolase family 55 protein [Botrytis fragariae]KAF5873393.1 putative glycoside hydrolase family 55 protein [Botrytis fragariae]
MSHSSNSPLRQYGEHTKEATLCAQDGLFEIWDGRPDEMMKVDLKDIKITGRRQHVNYHHFTPFGRPHIHFFKPSFLSRRHNSKLKLHSFPDTTSTSTSCSSWSYFTMASFSIISILLALRFFFIVSGAPTPVPTDAVASTTAASSSYWLASIQRQGIAPFGDASYQIFRNVKDFGAVGDGVTDDTAAINSAISSGNRCGKGCDSTTVTPALVYFPPGTYAISAPIKQQYFTQLVGDAVTLPTIKGLANFAGMALLDADPYDPEFNWFTNQNNFYRQIRNFVIDLTAMPASTGSGIHWQVAQATSLQNIVFNMRTDGGEGNNQQGIFMDNGSGGFMADLTFNGGKYGAFLGSQQFTSRNLTFNNCQTAIYLNWAWLWTFKDIKINNCGVGLDMSAGGASSRAAGSATLMDSTIVNTPIGISTVYDVTETGTNGTLVIDNVDFSSNVPVAVYDATSKSTVLAGNAKIASWAQGKVYTGVNAGAASQGSQDAVTKPAVLLDSTGKLFGRTKPQYETLPASSFLSVKSNGAKGDGTTDDTAAIQAIFDKATTDQIVYFDHGAYVVTDTIKVPKNIKITGEIWPMIMAKGFNDQANPKAVFQVGQVGDTGSVEISDIVFQTMGPAAGAILIEWNVKETSQGSAGMWDVHTRIGGSAGTQLQSNTCAKNPNATHSSNPDCIGAFMLLHVTEKASIYLENNWFWVADHELDLTDHTQIDVYSGRGILIASEEGPTWMYGTASEHNVLYNYQLANASNIFMGAIQTETPYYQSNPDSTTPFTTNSVYGDPSFTGGSLADKAWGVRIVNSEDVFITGAGLYSFFDNYSQDCLQTSNCQSNMLSIEGSGNIHITGLSTVGVENMITVDGQSGAVFKDNRNTFAATIAMFKGADTGVKC